MTAIRVLGVALTLLLVQGALALDRIRLNPLTLEGLGAKDGGSPERYSGYFKLDRAYDAHMFFFYFEVGHDIAT